MNVIFKWKGDAYHALRLNGVESKEAVYKAVNECLETKAHLRLIGYPDTQVIHRDWLPGYDITFEENV